VVVRLLELLSFQSKPPSHFVFSVSYCSSLFAGWNFSCLLQPWVAEGMRCLVSSAAVEDFVFGTASWHVWCKTGRYDINAWRCGTQSTPSKSMYLDAQQVVHCQATGRDVGPCAVKHHFPSPIVSWIEDLSSFGSVSFSPDSEYVDEQARASVGQSSTSSNLHDMQIVRSLSFPIHFCKKKVCCCF